MSDKAGAAALRKKDSHIIRITALLVILSSLLLLVSAFWFYFKLRGSLPQLDGELPVDGLSKNVMVHRDQLGIPTIRAENRQDAACALGFLHAQDRFFQMDGMRRYSAGEISELFGRAAIPTDRTMRLHRFRMRARGQLELLSKAESTLLEAYAAGVNAGLASLKSNPFEYLVLQIDPVEWRPEDSFLVTYFMYLALQGLTPELELTLGVMKEILPLQLFEFLVPKCTDWDAPLKGDPCQTSPIPGPRFVSLRPVDSVRLNSKPPHSILWMPTTAAGSNNWAVAGNLTAHGGALLANDMHLGMYVPNTWYRASLAYTEGGNGVSVTGVTLPGGPMVVAGSNTKIAWGFTNSMGDWADLVIVEPGSENDTYLTLNGPRPYERVCETIRVRFEEDEDLEISSTIWGPLFDNDYQHRPRALRWVAHDSEAVNLGLLNLETADTVVEAIDVANLAGIPAQNFTVVDSQGNIGWTIAGPMPRRYGHDGRVPRSWADGSCGWDGWLAPEEKPRVINPEVGRIWTANARVVGGEELEKIGDGGYRFAARARQIRDGLLRLARSREADMLRIQLDDRALYMESWQELLLEVLTPEIMGDDSLRREIRTHVENWGGRAAVDSVGYRFVRLFHDVLAEEISGVLLEPCLELDPRVDYGLFQDREVPLWRLVREQPSNFVHPRYENWQEQFLAAVDTAVLELMKDGSNLGHRTWGERNTVQFHHPLSLVFPLVARRLDMSPQPLPGDLFMPRVQTLDKGASERFVVSPGREEDGIFHMPCGQSGHPLSPHYSDGHAAWVNGDPTPFLPGPPVHTLTLAPLWSQTTQDTGR